MEMVIEYEKNIEEWERKISRDGISPFHSVKFLEPLRSGKTEPVYLKFVVDNSMVGGLSGIVCFPKNKIIKKVDLFKHGLFYSGPFFFTECIDDDIAGKLRTFLKRNGFMKFIIKGYDNTCLLDFQKEDFFSDIHDDWVLDLSHGYEIFYRNIKKRNKVKVKKANKEGLQFKISEDPALAETLYELLGETAKSREERELDDFIWDCMPFVNQKTIAQQVKNGIGRFGYVTDGHEVLSIQYFIYHFSYSYGIYIGTSEKGYRFGANAKVFHDVAKYLMDNGVKRYNIGHTAPGPGREGLVFFKSGFGAECVDCYSYTSPLLQGKVMNTISNLNRKIKKSHKHC